MLGMLPVSEVLNSKNTGYCISISRMNPQNFFGVCSKCQQYHSSKISSMLPVPSSIRLEKLALALCCTAVTIEHLRNYTSWGRRGCNRIRTRTLFSPRWSCRSTHHIIGAQWGIHLFNDVLIIVPSMGEQSARLCNYSQFSDSKHMNTNREYGMISLPPTENFDSV